MEEIITCPDCGLVQKIKWSPVKIVGAYEFCYCLRCFYEIHRSSIER